MATSVEESGPAAPAPTGSRGSGIGRRLSRRRYTALLAGLLVLLAGAVLVGVGVGAVDVSPGTSSRIVINRLFPGSFPVTWEPLQEQIIWSFRMPRVLLGVLVGAGLSLVGAVLQTLVRNPLAEPYVLGVSAGASLGAVAGLVLGSAAIGGLGLSAAAFAGALAATAVVYLLAQRRGRVSAPRLILAGVALAYLFQAGSNYLLLQTQTVAAAQSVLFWLLGSLAGAEWSMLTLPALALAVGAVALLLQARALNALLSGEESAVSLGINVRRFQLQMLVATSLVVGVSVSVTGAIAFVGLIVPHVARLLVGADHLRMLPVAGLLGAAFLVLVDLAARTLDQPTELPLTIVTAVLGVPFFLWLLRRRQRNAGEILG